MNDHDELGVSKDPAIAVVLSFLFTGLGQLYNGQYAKAFVLMVFYAAAWALTWVLIGWLIVPFVWLLGMIDAHASAKRINAQLAAGRR